MIKSQSDGSLTSATSCDDSISMSSGVYDYWWLLTFC
jgi:hypothetical protein